MSKINLSEIEIAFDGPGEYGLHDGFFNAIAIIDGKEYDFQCCAESDPIDFNDCGFDWGLSRDANNDIAKKVGWDNVLVLLEKAYSQYSG